MCVCVCVCVCGCVFMCLSGFVIVIVSGLVDSGVLSGLLSVYFLYRFVRGTTRLHVHQPGPPNTEERVNLLSLDALFPSLSPTITANHCLFFQIDVLCVMSLTSDCYLT